jgi:hypothetical protein
MVQFHHGVKPNDPRKARLYFSMFKAAGAVPPASADYTGFPNPGMLGNDQYGDCVEAGNGHMVMQQTFFGQGSEFTVTTSDALNEYTRITGFNPADPNTDQGTMIQDGLNDLRKNGFSGHKIAAFAQLDPTKIDDVKLAVAEFGAVSIGFAFPQSAMNQFNTGKPWDVVKGSPIEGGHCVIVMGYDAQYLYVITWGAVQKMTYAFWNEYVVRQGGEAWAVIDQEWVNQASGKDVEGVDLQAFGAQFAALTGQANPFPAPAPTPPPVPDPVPVPVPSPDAALLAWWEAVHSWSLSRHYSKATKTVAKANIALAQANNLPGA